MTSVGCQIVLEGSGDVLMESRWFHSIPHVDDLVFLSTDGGSEVGYKVEVVEVHLSTSSHPNQQGQTVKESISSTVKIIVSLIP